MSYMLNMSSDQGDNTQAVFPDHATWTEIHEKFINMLVFHGYTISAESMMQHIYTLDAEGAVFYNESEEK